MPTYVQRAAQLLEKLCAGLGLQSDYETFRDVQHFFLSGWGDREIPQRPAYASNIGDDHSPFEYSVALGRQRVELRLLVEIQGEQPGNSSNQVAAMDFNGRMAARYGAQLERFDRIKDLFLLDSPSGPFSLWHAVCLAGNSQHDFKIYLNPWARGRHQANELVKSALERLGMPELRRFVGEVESSAARGTSNYFSLDLSDSPNARVKVYFQHDGASAGQIDQLFEQCPTHQRGDVIEFCRALVGGAGPFQKKPLTTCFSFVQGREHPTAVTFHLPIAHYVASDAVCADRVAKYLASQSIDPTPYSRSMREFAMRPLTDGAGIQSYASFRREGADIRFTAYLSPELFRSAEKAAEARVRPASRSSEYALHK